MLAGVLLCGCTAASTSATPPADTPDTTTATAAEPTSAKAPPGTSTSGAPIPPAESQVTPAAQAGFDGARAWKHLERQVQFGPRPSGSRALQQTRSYILEQLKAAGIKAVEQPFTATTPTGRVAMANVAGTIPGRRPERIILASHFDTKLFTDVRFVGANDGASSTAALLELGRVLAGRQSALTIELLFLDGEEAVVEWSETDSTYGSRHYVNAARQNGSLAGIRAFVLLDMIGDRDLTIRRDSNSTPWLTDIVWTTAARLGHGGLFIREVMAIEDDHLPFLRAGVPAVDIIDLDNPTWHTPLDDLAHVSQQSLQIVGDVVLAALPEIEQRLAR
jgi:glutaminyl-peptide cyclotransferase